MWAIQRLADSLYFPIVLTVPPPADVEWIVDSTQAMPFITKGECDGYRLLYLETVDENGNVSDPISQSIQIHLPDEDFVKPQTS